MTKIRRNCWKCDLPMVFDTEAMTDDEKAAFRASDKIGHAEGLCPQDVPEEPDHTYRIEVAIFRDDDDEPAAKVAGSVTGTSFNACADAAAEALNRNWVRLLEMASMVDD